MSKASHNIEHISWYHFLSLATNNSSWLTWAFAAVLDVPYLLGYSSPIEFVLIFSGCLECRFFLLHKQFYHLFMLVLHLFLVFKTSCSLVLFLCISFDNMVSSTIWFFLNKCYFCCNISFCLYFIFKHLNILVVFFYIYLVLSW